MRDDITSLVAGMWDRMRYVSIERVDLVMRALIEMGAGRATAEQRQEAAVAAHKLVGALGTYGFDDGTEIARRAEELLVAEHDVPRAATDAVVEQLVALHVILDSRPVRPR